MGLYSTLSAPVKCPSCGGACPNAWQFNFGGVSHLPVYSIGDRIQWDGTRMGSPDLAEHVDAIAYCASEHLCERCQRGAPLAEIQIRGGVIKSIALRDDDADVLELFYVGETRVPYGWTPNGRRIDVLAPNRRA